MVVINAGVVTQCIIFDDVIIQKRRDLRRLIPKIDFGRVPIGVIQIHAEFLTGCARRVGEVFQKSINTLAAKRQIVAQLCLAGKPVDRQCIAKFLTKGTTTILTGTAEKVSIISSEVKRRQSKQDVVDKDTFE